MLIEDPRLNPYSILFEKGSYSVRKLIKTKPKDTTKEDYDRTKYVCNSSSMGGAIEKVIMLKLQEKNAGKAVSLIEYYKVLKEMSDSISLILDVNIASLNERLTRLENKQK